MNVIIVGEFTGIVRDAFIEKGHNATSNDLLPSESPGPHIQADCKTLDYSPYDLMIAHPSCRFLTKAGAGKFWDNHRAEQKEAIDFVLWLYNRPVPRICIENPAGILTKSWRPPDQYIDPWWFGHWQKKHTGLWLKNFPPLLATLIHPAPAPFIKGIPETKDRWKKRSRTFSGVASAMAAQWGILPVMEKGAPKIPAPFYS
ncbi:DNA cytosine methyltransferase [Patescibacteria group bacterium]|nr:DNA cytosine methyltransferase [Patescibacteria group bacterium]